MVSDALVIGTGPAGLMAAEELAKSGHHVILCEAKPSVGRKFLMAGKSGLNLTKDEPMDAFLTRFSALGPLEPALRDFGPEAVKSWVQALGQEVFTGSSGRVFPKAMKASPLLRAWMQRLNGLGVELRTNHRWQGWNGVVHRFTTPAGDLDIRADVAVLALGGASWARLGSDGQWAEILAERGVDIIPFAPANAGLSVKWSDHMHRQFGQPVKGVALSAAEHRERGEFVVTRHGLEGGGIYSMTRYIRDGGALTLDLLPDWSLERVTKKLTRRQGKATLSNHLRKVLKLNPVKLALLMEFGRPLPNGPALAALIKALPIRHTGPRPMDEAISTAGGVAWGAVDDGLMLREHPGIYVCGEMLDWEAPTGGYLITACLASGRWAGQQAAARGLAAQAP